MKANTATRIMEDMVGKRFDNQKEIAEFIRKCSGEELPNLTIGSKQKSDNLDIDDYMDCCFGENECDMQYPDFIIYYIKTNAKQLYITEVDWL